MSKGTSRPDLSRASSSAHFTSTTAVRRRLKRQLSQRSLVAETATEAYAFLEEFATIPKPEWARWKGSLYGSFIDMLIVTRLPVGDRFTRAIVSCGGPEQMRFMLALAQFDADGNGQIDDSE